MKNRTSGRRTALIAGGALATMVGLGAVAGGGALVWAHTTQRDSAGFYSTDDRQFTTSSFALTSGEIDFEAGAAEAEWLPGTGTSVLARVQATGADERPVFVGIARQADVDSYLARSAHDELTDFDLSPFEAEYRHSPGDVQPAVPADQDFWIDSTNGPGTQTLTTPMEDEDLAVVVMNADASAGVTADIAVGAKTGLLLPVGLGLLGLAAVSLGLGATGLAFGLRDGGQTPNPWTGGTGAPGGSTRMPAGDRVGASTG